MTETNEFCHFCKAAPFKYTCPKCNAIYCSVGCYKSKEHLKCSEEFFKSCIQDELASATTTPESQQDMRKIYDILKRMRDTDAGFKPADFDADGLDNPLDSDDEARAGQSDDEEEEGEGEADGTEKSFVDETEEFIDLAARLKGIDINDADEVWNRLTSEEQQEFQKLIVNGDIMKLIPDYKPWWSKNSKIVVLNEAKEDTPEIQENIPKFADICKKTPSPCLHYNLWNILSAYACIARFYNGEQRTNPSEAVAHLVNLSATLKYNTNYEDAEDAIISVEMEACTTGNTPAGAGTNFLVESREQLQEDARQLMSTRQYKLAALSDILHLLQQSKALSKRKNPEEAAFQKLFALRNGTVELNRNKLCQLIKKLEFMLSYVAREEVL